MAKGTKRRSDWTHIYWGSGDDGRLGPYVRLVPSGLNVEAHGFPHGISLAGRPFDSKEEAIAFADRVDRFMDMMQEDLIEDVEENGRQDPSRTWGKIYWDANAHEGLHPYVRLLPYFMDTEAAGFPHGISLGGQGFTDEAAAQRFLDRVNRLMEAWADAFLDSRP